MYYLNKKDSKQARNSHSQTVTDRHWPLKHKGLSLSLSRFLHHTHLRKGNYAFIPTCNRKNV